MTMTCSGSGISSAARSPAIPLPTISTSVNTCEIRLGWKRTRYRCAGVMQSVFKGKSNEIDFHRAGNDFRLVGPRKQRLHRLAAARAEIQRPVVHVHSHKRIGPLAIEVAPVLFGILQRFLTMRQSVTYALPQQVGQDRK